MAASVCQGGIKRDPCKLAGLGGRTVSSGALGFLQDAHFKMWQSARYTQSDLMEMKPEGDPEGYPGVPLGNREQTIEKQLFIVREGQGR